MIDGETRTFNSGMGLTFDVEGRLSLYDGLAQNLPRKIGTIAIGTSLAGFYMFYTTPSAMAMTTTALMQWGGLGLFTMVTMTHLRLVVERAKRINRIYQL